MVHVRRSLSSELAASQCVCAQLCSIASVMMQYAKNDTPVMESQNGDPARYIIKILTTCRMPKAPQNVTTSIPQGTFEVPATASFQAMPIIVNNKIQHAGVSRPKKVARFKKRRTFGFCFCLSAVVNGDSNGLSGIGSSS